MGLTVAWREVFAALFFYNNYDIQGSMPLGHIWSLSVEEHSYILLSIIAFFTRRFQLDAKWLIFAFAALFSAFGFYYWSKYNGAELDFKKWIHSEVSAFGIFISASILLFISHIKLIKFPIWFYFFLFFTGLALHWWSVPPPVRTTLGVGLFAFLVNILVKAPDLVKNILEFKPLILLGTWSFSIYLWQQPFYYASRNLQIMSAYTAVALALCFGVASFYLIENPIRLFLNRTWTGKNNV